MKKITLILSLALALLVVFSSLCINRPPTKTTIPSKDILTFIDNARKNLRECNATLKKPLAPGSNLRYLNMTVLNETTIKLEGKKYRYVILGIWNVSFSGEVNINGYKIV